jgi:hypothetical protein
VAAINSFTETAISRPKGAPYASPGQRPERAVQPMRQSLARLHMHLVFSTKNRGNTGGQVLSHASQVAAPGHHRQRFQRDA